MGLITASTLSQFPTEPDTWGFYYDTPEASSALNANIFNKIMAALHRTQTHAQYVPRFIHAGGGGESRSLVTYQQTLTVGNSQERVMRTVTLDARTLSLLGNQPWRAGNLIFASCRPESTTSNDAMRATVRPLSDTQVEVTLDRANRSQQVAAGTYRLSLTFMGR